jgi:hypothetical protein
MATRARHFMALPRVGWPAAPVAMPQRGGGRKSGAKALTSTTAPLTDRFFSWIAQLRTAGQKWRGQAGRERPAELLGPSPAKYRTASPYGLGGLIRAHLRTGFATTRTVRFSGRIFSYFRDCASGAMNCKGTVGTWEQSLSNRQNALPLRGASLFPRRRAVSGTWEQKWPIPMQENPRACGHPVPPPAGGRGSD